MRVPVWQDPVTEEDYEGVARLISKENHEFTFGGKKFEQWLVVFENEDIPVIRTVSREYIRILFKGKTEYFGPNGPTGHGDICHSDADEGL